MASADVTNAEKTREIEAAAQEFLFFGSVSDAFLEIKVFHI